RRRLDLREILLDCGGHIALRVARHRREAEILRRCSALRCQAKSCERAGEENENGQREHRDETPARTPYARLRGCTDPCDPLAKRRRRGDGRAPELPRKTLQASLGLGLRKGTGEERLEARGGDELRRRHGLPSSLRASARLLQTASSMRFG